MRNVIVWMLLAGAMVLEPLGFIRASSSPPDTSPSFSLTIAPAQAVVKAGSPVYVEIAKKNASDHAISMPRVSMSPFPSYGIDVRDEEGRLRPETEEMRKLREAQDAQSGHFMGSIRFRKLRPGESGIDGVVVSRFYDMSAPGKYAIQVYQTDAESKTVVKSNVITVTVTP